MSQIHTQNWIAANQTSVNASGSAGADNTSVSNVDTSISQDLYKFDIDIDLEGFIYYPQDITVIASMAILIIYCAYVLVFMILILFNPLSSNAWDSIAELTALGILSAPTERLRNTSAGIEMMDTFRQPVNIKAAGDDHLEIVFEKDERSQVTETIKLNQEY
ncbi:hypothetical protein BKCO1_7600010 [Neofusicoccum parvum]|uniref:Uncharacterized protein n=1 Tax=Neofusicoccum parvum TaxID=310453 RepID=A0ACB5RNY5_9PEZI|nr:hypothetical protein BKCO1_7600010 [Neofusicoccum parvum]